MGILFWVTGVNIPPDSAAVAALLMAELKSNVNNFQICTHQFVHLKQV